MFFLTVSKSRRNGLRPLFNDFNDCGVGKKVSFTEGGKGGFNEVKR